MNQIARFDEEHHFLSNFAPSEVRLQVTPGSHITVATVEHAFQASKTTSIRDRLWVARQSTPGRAKRAGSKRGLNGRKIELRSDWEAIKVGVMEMFVRRKFTNHDNLRELLLDTGDAQLIEGNNWHDTFWGVCDGRCRFDPGHTPEGDNELGKLLEKIRSEMAALTN